MASSSKSDKPHAAARIAQDYFPKRSGVMGHSPVDAQTIGCSALIGPGHCPQSGGNREEIRRGDLTWGIRSKMKANCLTATRSRAVRQSGQAGDRNERLYSTGILGGGRAATAEAQAISPSPGIRK